MELKLILYYQKRQELPRLNCTVMELKLLYLWRNQNYYSRLNCTVMELKLDSAISCESFSDVLIVPLWN